MAIAVPLAEGASLTLKQRLARAERVNRWKAQALIAPLVLFLLLVFLVPIVALLYKSVGNPEVVNAMPHHRCGGQAMGRQKPARRARVQSTE